MNPRIKRLLSMLLALTMVFSLTTPVSASTASTTAASSNTVEIEVGETSKLKVSGIYSKTTWTSSDEAVATVSSNGTVTGVAPGTATITATSKNYFSFWGGTKTTKFTVVVMEPEETLTVKAGETLQLDVETSGGKVTWKSSNKKIATVDGKGLVTGVSEGDVTITATEKKTTGGNGFWFFWWGSGKTTTTVTEFEVTVLPGDEQPTEPPVTEPPVVYYTVTFESNGGSAVAAQTVAEGDTATEPEAPTMDGYTFAGWYADAELTEAYDFATPVTTDITLYAAWEEVINYYTVTFESNGGSDVDAQTVAEGETATEPEVPVLEGYTFAGWYTDAELTAPYEFATPVTADITLYARWRVEDNLEDEIIDLGDIENLISQGEIEVIYDEDGDIQTIDGLFTDKTVESAEDAADVLNSASSLFGDEFYADVDDIVCQMVDAGTTDAESYYRYSPTINGITVLGSQIIMSTDENATVTGLFSTFNEDIYSVDTDATISEEEAVNVAFALAMSREDVVAFLDSLQDDAVDFDEIKIAYQESLSAHTELMVYAADESSIPVLVYAVTITKYEYSDQSEDVDIEESTDESSSGSPVIDTTYYVYANGTESGTLFKTIQNSEGWATVDLEGTDLNNQTRSFVGQEEDGTYRLKDTTRNIITYKTATTGALWWKEYVLPGNIAKSTSFFGDEWINKAAVSAHANMTHTYDFYNNILGRRSFDGNGATVKVSYDYGSNYKNAYWTPSGQQFVFGSGDDYVAALDIVAHEYTHAVINYVVGNGYTTTLTYSGETGALNEAYADIMGNLIEGKTGTDLWNHGEDKGTVTRSMANPTAYNQPDHYSALSDPQWSAQLDRYVDRDNEGVHIFGGVYCHAVYLMMTDNRCSDISQTTWAKVFYRSLFRLATDASFLDGRGAVISSAKNLGFTQAQLQAVKDAFDDVGIVEPDGVRIVLQWGESPSDLDSHIVGPGIVSGERFHVYYGQRNYYRDGTYSSETAQYAVDLDYDDTTAFGPEVTTIHLLTPGEYYFYVHDFSNGSSSNSTAMAYSGATVKVYRGSSNVAIAEYEVDPSSCGTYWNVFKLTIGGNMTITIESINTYGSSPSYS